MSIDTDLANGNPDAPFQYVAIGYFCFENMDTFEGSMGPNSEKLWGDVPNYANIKTMIQISEVQTVE